MPEVDAGSEELRRKLRVRSSSGPLAGADPGRAGVRMVDRAGTRVRDRPRSCAGLQLDAMAGRQRALRAALGLATQLTHRSRRAADGGPVSPARPLLACSSRRRRHADAPLLPLPRSEDADGSVRHAHVHKGRRTGAKPGSAPFRRKRGRRCVAGGQELSTGEGYRSCTGAPPPCVDSAACCWPRLELVSRDLRRLRYHCDGSGRAWPGTASRPHG